MPDFKNLIAQASVPKEQNTQNTLAPALDNDKSMRSAETQDRNASYVNVDPGQRLLDAEGLKTQTSNIQAYNQNEGLAAFDRQEANFDVKSGDKTNKTFLAEFGANVVAGFGRDIIGSTGTIINTLGAGLGFNEYYQGNWVGNQLAEAGQNMEDKHGTVIPEELRDPSMSIQTFFNPEFWSTHVASMIPQLAEFILLSKGIGSGVRAGLNAAGKAVAKNSATGLLSVGRKTLQGATKSASTGAKAVTGELNAGGALKNVILETGALTNQAAMVAETLGAGIGSNVISGLLNASQNMATHRDMKNADGSNIYNEDELGSIASQTFQNNLKYLPVDILSWGLTYGNGAKILKNMRGGFGTSTAQSGQSAVARAAAAKAANQTGSKAVVQAASQVESQGVKQIGEGLKGIGEGTKRLGPKMSTEVALRGEQGLARTGQGLATVGEQGVARTAGAVEQASGQAVGQIGQGVKEVAQTTLKKASKEWMVGTGSAWKGLSRIAKKAGKPIFEGAEETMQETWEEWSQLRAVEDVMGKDSKYGETLDNFFDFYMSKDSEATRAIAFGMGLAGGSASALVSNINETSERDRQLMDSSENLRTMFKAGDEDGNTMRKFHMQTLASDAILNGKKADVLAHLASFQQQGSVSESEIESIIEVMDQYEALNQQADKLNVRGKVALFKAHSNEVYLQGHLDQMELKLNESIALINAFPDMDETQKAKKIQELEFNFNEEAKGIIAGIAKSKFDKGNLISGKKNNSAIKIEFKNVKGVDIPVVGLMDGDYEYYVTDNSEDILAGKNRRGLKRGIDRSSLKGKAKLIYDQIASKFKKTSKTQNEESTTEEENVTEETQGQETKRSNEDTSKDGSGISQNKKPEFEPLSEEEQNEVNDLQKVIDEYSPLIESGQAKIDKIKKAIATGGYKNKNELKAAEDKIVALEAGIQKIKDTIKANQDKIKNIRTQPKKTINNDLDENDEIDSSAPDNLKDAKSTDKTINPKVAEQLANLVKKGKDKLTPEQLELYNKFQDAVDSFFDKVGSRTKRFNDYVTSQEFTDKVKKAREKAAKQAKATKKAGFDVASTAGKSKAFQKAKKATQDAMDIFKAFKAYNMFEGKESRKNIKFTTQKVVEFEETNEVETSTELTTQELVVFENVFTSNEAVEALEQSIPIILNSRIGMLKWGPSNTDIMSAVNERMMDVFPNMDEKPRVIILDNLKNALGIEGVGYAIAATVYVQRDEWNQGKKFMHEMGHIYFKMARNEPATKKIISQLLKEQQPLIQKIANKYIDKILYEFTNTDGTTKVGNLHPAFWKKSPSELKAMGIVMLPVAQQDIILEEAFVAYLEGPLSEKYNNFFAPRDEFKRQKSSVSWWNPIAINAKNNGLDAAELIQKIEGTDTLLKNTDNIRDYIVQRFQDQVGEIDNDGIGFESRTDAYKSSNLKESKAEMENLAKQQAEFTTSVFERQNEVFDEMSTLDEVTEEELMEQDSNDGISPLVGLLNKTFKGDMSKATRILRQFIKDYNKALRLRRAYGIEAPLFDRRDFMYKMFEYAKYTDNVPTFLKELKKSADPEIIAFMEFLKIKAAGQDSVILNGIHMVMGNFKMVNAAKTALIKNADGSVEFQINESLSGQEQGRVQNIMSALDRDRQKSIAYSKGGMLTKGASRWSAFEKTMANIKNNKATPEDYYNAWHYIAGPSNIKMQEILMFNRMNYLGSSFTPTSILKSFVDKNLHLGKDKSGVNYQSQFISAFNLKPLANILVVTNRAFTQDSLVQNAKNNSVPVRITNNNISKELDVLKDALKPNEKGEVISKEKFLKKFSHITNNKGAKSSGNMFLDNYYDRVVKFGIDTDMVYYTGLDDKVSNKAKTYDESTAFEQSYEDFMMYVMGSKNATYLHNMGVLGDSPRKFYIPTKRINYKDVFDDKGNINPKSEVVQSAYNINKNITIDKNEDGSALTKNQFIKNVQNDVQTEIDFFNKNAKQLQKIKQLADSFTNGKLNSKGERLVREYSLNVMANGMYMTEVFAPGIKTDEIEKRMKNSGSPVYSVNKNLKFDALVYKDAFTADGSNQTDGGQYILEEDAIRWRNAGMGIMDFNEGFKFLNYSIEKDNPNFKGQTLLFKGYTTVLSEAEVQKNPGLRGLYDMMKSRKKKYDDYHVKKYGGVPTLNFSDGLPNSFPIAIPQSSVKGNVLLSKSKEAPALSELGTTDGDSKANSWYDSLSYTKSGRFMGLSAYNFGPQQVMDKITKTVTLPVQQMNSALVFAATIGNNLQKAEEIQRLYSAEMESEINKVIGQIYKSDGIKGYSDFIKNNIDKEKMDPVQLWAIEQNDINHPRAHQIIVNTLANQLKVKGNKLTVPGSYSHQKSDYGYRLPDGAYVNGSDKLNGYLKGVNGTRPAEIVLPNHLGPQFIETKDAQGNLTGRLEVSSGDVQARKYYTIFNADGKLASKQGKKAAPGIAKDSGTDKIGTDLMFMQEVAIREAQSRFGFANSPLGRQKASNMVHNVNDAKGNLIGYYVEGEKVIATRVPSNGPNFTGVFEVIDFATGKGNQVQVPASFSKIAGADLDGDALFIQHKVKNGSENINKAIQKTIDLWLQPEMYEAITTEMRTEQDGQLLKDYLKKQFNDKNVQKHTSFTPASRRLAYNNSMIAKRNVGTVFNLHRTANVLAAYNADIKMNIKIDGKYSNDRNYNTFTDDAQFDKPGIQGQKLKSRNYNSALIANLILDNLKNQTADSLNLNEHTVNAFTLLVNLGVPIEDVAVIMNAPMVKAYVGIQDENNSAYNGYTKKSDQLKALEKMKVKNIDGTISSYMPSRGVKKAIVAKATDPNFYTSSNQSAIIDLISELDTLNSEIQSIAKIMAGHNGIETNPHLLEKQINDFKEVVQNKRNYVSGVSNNKPQILRVPVEMYSNPDIQRYLNTAEKTLVHTKKLDYVYRPAVSNLFKNLGKSINENGLTGNQIKKYSNTVQQFLNSRLLNTNTLTPEYFENLVNLKSPNNVFSQLENHMQNLMAEGKLKNNMLLSQALNKVLSGNRPIISMNKSFFDESIVKQEFRKIQQEFEALPESLQQALFDYDILTHRWDSTYSLLPIMGKVVNKKLMNKLNDDFKNKQNSTYDPSVLKELERIIVAKDFVGDRNNFKTIEVKANSKGGISINELAGLLNKDVFFNYKLNENEPFYVAVNKKTVNPNPAVAPTFTKMLFYFPGLANPDVNFNQEDRIEERSQQAARVLKRVKTDDKNLDISLITILDPSLNRTEPTPVDNNEAFVEVSKGMEARDEYWRYNGTDEMTKAEFEAAMEFDINDSDSKKKILYEKYQQDKKKANSIFKRDIEGENLNSYSDKQLMDLYELYAIKNPYAYAIVTTPIIRALAAKGSAEQSVITGRYQTREDVSAISAFLMANNIPSNHPAVQSLVRKMEIEHKSFMGQKRIYAEKINKATDALYQKVYGFSMDSKTPWNLAKRLYYSLMFNRKNLYDKLYGPLIMRETVYTDSKPIEEFKLKPKAEIEKLYKSGELSQEHYNFYNMFNEVTKELEPFSTESGRKRTEYIPHVNMGMFESFANRGLLGIMTNSKPSDERVLDVKLEMKNPNTGKDEKWTFKEVTDFYKVLAVQSGNSLDKIVEYKKLQLKAKGLLKKGINEDGSRIEHNPMEVDSAFNLGIMNRFTKGRSVTSMEMPTMDLNHALMTFTHTTLFVNGNKEFGGFKKMQAVMDGILSFNEENNLGNINKYVKTVWKDKFLQGKSQILISKPVDAVVDMITKLNLFYQLGGKVSYVLGNIASGKYHNIKNGKVKEWALGEKRFWGMDNVSDFMNIPSRMKRSQRILKNLNFMDINIFDNVSFQNANRLDSFFGDLALMPMAWSEKWIQGVQMLGMLSEEQWNKFDDNGDYKANETPIENSVVAEMENKVKLSQGKGYQLTDQRMVQTYSMGRMFMQFARFLPTMFYDRFGKEDIDIYGKTTIGSLRALKDTVMKVRSLNPKAYKDYMDQLKKDNPEKHDRVVSGLKGLAMSTVIGAFAFGGYENTETSNSNSQAKSLFWDTNYYANPSKLAFKVVPSAARNTGNIVDSMFN